jgi:hypothetical protein
VYPNGIKAGAAEGSEFPDFASVIPKREGYTLADSAPYTVKFSERAATEIQAYKYRAGEIEFAVAPHYVPLLSMGGVFAKDSKSPILVLGGDSLNDELLAVIMPMRV